MTTKPITKLQREKIEESLNALTGLGPYVKSTAAEPTLEQFKKIQIAFRRAESAAAQKKNQDMQLEIHINSFFHRNPEKLPDLSLFWDEIRSLNDPNKVSPRNQSNGAGKHDDLIYEYVTKHTLNRLELANLARSNGRTLTELCPYAKKAFVDAIERDDVEFLKRVGDVLRKRQRKPEFWLEYGYSKIQVFLMNHWVKEFDGVPPLYNLSMTKLWRICQQKLGNEMLTVDAVEKARQRLGLLTFRKGSQK